MPLATKWDAFLGARGSVADASDLRLPRARSLVAYALGGDAVGARFVEARQTDRSETVVLDVLTEVGQLPKVDIRNIERVAVEFADDDLAWPQVWALRPSFPPALIHTNVVPEGLPPSICLGEERFTEIRRTLTSEKYVERLRHWFGETSRGRLHPDDQPLEPFLVHAGGVMILPGNFEALPDGPTLGHRVEIHGLTRFRLIKGDAGPLRACGLVVTSSAQVHGRIQTSPKTLRELANLFPGGQFDVVAALRAGLRQILESGDTRVNEHTTLLLILRTPMKRDQESDIERIDANVFWLRNIDVVAAKLGVWQRTGGARAAIIPSGTPANADAIEVIQLSTEFCLTKLLAGAYSGLNNSGFPTFVSVGAGALGSQILVTLGREGILPEAIIDSDYVAPHNVARHALYDESIGDAKVGALAEKLNALYSDARVQAIEKDILTLPGTDQDVLRVPGAILDVSASGAVAWHLARRDDVARTIAFFLNPNGTDLVLLAEDRTRKIRMQDLEVQYYWAILTDKNLEKHLSANRRIRFGVGCRDRSAVVSTEAVATLAGIGARAFRSAASDDAAVINIWRLHDDGSVARFDIAVEPMMRLTIRDWTCAISRTALSDMSRLRTEAAQKETGGALLGTFDLDECAIYVAGVLDAPHDSVATATSFDRGTEGLLRSITAINEQSAGQLEYVGEWHSHPRGYTSSPSGTDDIAYAELSFRMRNAGYPETMLVIGEDGITCIIDGNKELAKWPT